MRIFATFFVLIFLFPSCRDACDHNSTVYFPNYEKARNIITNDSFYSYYERVTDADMQLQLGRKINEDRLEETFLRATASTIVKPDKQTKIKLESALDEVLCSLAILNKSLIPDSIKIAIIDGTLMGQSTFYTRAKTIFCPLPEIEHWSISDSELIDVMAHETFHIISRTQPELREELYELLGYISLDSWKPANNGYVSIPDKLNENRIINPDESPTHYVYPISDDKALINFLTTSDKDLRPQSYAESINWNLYEILYINNMFVVNENPAKERDISNSLSAIQEHTNYVIHPEEMIADIFAIIVLNGTGGNQLLESVERNLANFE